MIVLSNDSRTAIKITNCAKTLSDENEVECFYKIEDFEDFLKTDTQKALDKDGIAKLEISDKQKQGLFRKANIRAEGINLIIVDHEILGTANPVAYIQNLKERLAKSLFHKEEFQTRYMILSFEASVSSIDKLADPIIDDLLMKPIDDQLFMQKLSMVLSEKRTIISQFLYNQSVEFPIYMAKGTLIEEMSEVGFAISNKQGGTIGRVVRVFSKVFGEGVDSTLLARIFNVEDHPKIPGEILVYYTFYGITPKQLSSVRRLLHTKYGKPPHRQAMPQSEMKIIEKNKKNVAVIAFDAVLRQEIIQTLNASFINMTIHEYPSLISFGKKNGVKEAFDGSGGADGGSDGGDTYLLAFNADQFVFQISYSNEIVSIQTKKINLFDATDFQLISQQKKWMQYIDPEDIDETVEFLTYIKSHEKGSIYVRLRSPSGSLHLMNLEASKVKGSIPPKVKVQLTELKGEEGLQKWQTVRPKIDTKLQRTEFESIIIDTSSVTEEIQEWSTRLTQFLEKTKISETKKKLSIIAVLPESASAKLEAFRLTTLTDVITTPMDRKYVADKLSLYIDGLSSQFGLAHQKFKEYSAEINIAQTVILEMASEFGLQIRYSKPFKEGVFLRFYSQLFQDDNYDGILARSYAALPNEKATDEYHNIFSFYGISDSFMKQIRKWIREAHIAKKEG